MGDITSYLMDVGETAKFLHLKASTIRAWIAKKRLPVVRLGGRVFVRKEDAETLIQNSLIPAKP